MDDPTPTENPPADFNKLDLSQLQSFSFGTQWTQDKAQPGGGARPPREGRRDDRPFRPREGGGPVSSEPRRDRREFRRPGGPAGEGAPSSAPREGGQPPRSPRADGSGGGFRGPRRDDRAPRGDDRGGNFRGPRRDFEVERGPYISPFFGVSFYPEETSFATLVQKIRVSFRTLELFEIARAVVGKSERCIAQIQRLPAGGPPPAAGAAPAKPEPFAVSVPDSLPFETEEAAIAHVLATHLSTFFETSEAEVEPPKGNFQVINKCGVTGELLGPPNYHRYPQIMRQHHAARVRLPFEVFTSRIETVRDPEAVNQWLAKMKKVTRFTWKPAAEGDPTPSFDTIEDARQHLLATAREKVVRLVESWRFPGKNLDTLPPGEIRRAVEGALERQRRFPLDTANALRGRLRREGLHIFKKGSKGITYVCGVRRKFRTPDQVFADSLGALIAFIEHNPMVRRSELPVKFLGLKPVAVAEPVGSETTVPPPSAEPAAPAPVSQAPGEAAPAAAGAPPVAQQFSPEDRERMAKMHGDLRWLLSEGYVMEFMDGRLFTPPPVAAARKQEAETTEDDPENFPEAEATAPAAAVEEPAAAPAVTGSEPVAASPVVPAVASAESPAS